MEASWDSEVEVDVEVYMKVFASLVDGRALVHDACLKVDSP